MQERSAPAPIGFLHPTIEHCVDGAPGVQPWRDARRDRPIQVAESPAGPAALDEPDRDSKSVRRVVGFSHQHHRRPRFEAHAARGWDRREGVAPHRGMEVRE
jgi:hypothetical protein